MGKKHKHYANPNSSCGVCKYYSIQLNHIQSFDKALANFRKKHPKVPEDSSLKILCYSHHDSYSAESLRYAQKGSPTYHQFIRSDDWSDVGTFFEFQSWIKSKILFFQGKS